MQTAVDHVLDDLNTDLVDVDVGEQAGSQEVRENSVPRCRARDRPHPAFIAFAASFQASMTCFTSAASWATET